MVLGLAVTTVLVWYLRMRSGAEAPFFLYDYGSLRNVLVVVLGAAAVLPGGAWLLRDVNWPIPDERTAIVLLGGVAFALRAVAVLTADTPIPAGSSDQTHYWELAVAWSEGRLPEFFMPRGHVGLLWGILFRLTGPSVEWIQWLHAVLSTGSVLALYGIVRVGGGSRGLAFAIGGTFALLPSQIFYVRRLLAEVPFTFFTLAGAFGLLRAVAATSEPARGWLLWSLVAGAFFGLSHWMRPTGMLFLAVAVGVLLLSALAGRSRGRRAVAVGATVFVAFALSIVPLIMANRTVQGTWSPGYMEGRGFLLLYGTEPSPRGPTDRGYDIRQHTTLQELRAAWEAADHGPWSEFGSSAVQDFAADLAWTKIAANPNEFLSFSLTDKMAELWVLEDPAFFGVAGDWNPRWLVRTGLATYLLLLGGALSGATILAIRGPGPPGGVPLLATATLVVLSVATVHLLVTPFTRYHFHAVPWLVVVAGMGLARLADPSGAFHVDAPGPLDRS